jgi:SAM-dependent methyltransferase
MHTDLVRSGYDQIGEVYAAERERLKSGKYLHQFLQLLRPQSLVLDLGCGDGVPIDATLIKQGHLVMGIDVSPRQIERARTNCPTGDFRVGDMSSLSEGQYRVDAVVCYYALFHVSRAQHLAVIKKMRSFMPTGGLLLITMGDREFEGEHDLYGVRMWSSHYGPVKNRELVETAGFAVVLDNLDASGDERHQILIARSR